MKTFLIMCFFTCAIKFVFVCDAKAKGDRGVITKRFGFSVYTTDMTPIKLFIRDSSDITYFLIPKAYIKKSSAWRGGGRKRFIVRAVAPNMTPYSFSKIYGKEEPDTTVIIFVDAERVTEEYPKNAYNRMKKFNKIGEMSGLEAYRRDGNPKTCYRKDLVEGSTTADPLFKDIEPDGNSNYICWPYGDEYYVSKPEIGSRYISIKCPPLNGMNKSLKCIARTSFEGWKIEYMFYSPDRANWKYYDNKIQVLLNSLKVS